MREDKTNTIPRIKAPSIDTSALIKDNALTLIGRITNPQEQKIWALIPGLPRKWNLLGRAVGSDLGNNCFQFRFEREEDVRRVLDNRPYHFNYWMVILQRWEPVISNSFPSMIPFWVKIKGLPLHYWQDDMVCRVGQELGTRLNHELTTTTARVQVSVDGLKPLIKELIIEFDSGEETSVTLEYERLEYHCTHCFSLLHAKRNCPKRREEELSWNHTKNINAAKGTEDSDSSRAQQMVRREREQSKEVAETDRFAFRARVDRHGNPYGERVSTKQTRAPPPVPNRRPDTPSLPLQNQKPTQERPDNLLSPPFTQHRQQSYRETSRGRNLFPQRSQGQWRAKQPTGQEENPPRAAELEAILPRETPLPETLQTITNEPQVRTMEEVLEELHETTRRYLNCADPVEAAARRQRVLQGDALGQTEELAASIIAAETRRHSLFSQYMGSASNPNTPPPQQAVSLDVQPLPENSHGEILQNRERGFIELDDYSLEPNRRGADTTPQRGAEGSARLKSIIISPVIEPEEAPAVPQETTDQQRGEETLKEFQNKVKSKGRRTIQTRISGNSPNILRGTSSKKRKTSQIQNSPARGVGSPRGTRSGTQSKTNKEKSVAGTSRVQRNNETNPPINLIPARTKRSSDFRASPLQAP